MWTNAMEWVPATMTQAFASALPGGQVMTAHGDKIDDVKKSRKLGRIGRNSPGYQASVEVLLHTNYF